MQDKAFQEEIDMLKGATNVSVHTHDNQRKRTVVKRTSTLYKLDPFMDIGVTLRAGGRLRQTDMQNNLKH